MSEWRETFRGVVFPWNCDQFGHMNVRWYAHCFDDAAFHIWSKLGIGLRPMEARGIHTVVANTNTRFVHEITVGELYVIRSALTRLGRKSVSLQQKMLNADTGILHAVQDGTEVFFDPKTRKSAEIPDDIRKVIEDSLETPGWEPGTTPTALIEAHAAKS